MDMEKEKNESLIGFEEEMSQDTEGGAEGDLMCALKKICKKLQAIIDTQNSTIEILDRIIERRKVFERTKAELIRSYEEENDREETV